MSGDITEVHTGLYSDKAFKLLSHIVANQIKTRPWGNIRTQFESMNVERAPDGEVIFTPDPDKKNYYFNRIWSKSSNEALKWIAIYIKKFVRNFSSCWVNKKIDDIGWDRDNTHDKVEFVVDMTFYSVNNKKMFKRMFNGENGKFSVIAPIRDIYFIYDKFMLRKGLDKKYPSKMIDAYVGHPNDPITTEMETAKRQDIKNLEDEFNKDIEALHIEHEKEERIIENEYDNKINDLEERFEKKRQARRQKYLDDLESLVKSYDLSNAKVA